MRKLNNELKNRSLDTQKLLDYGFVKQDKKYTYQTPIHAGEFNVIVEIEEYNITSKLIDIENEEEYILVDVPSTSGAFVTKLRQEYETQIQNIIKNCTNIDVFKNNQTQEVIQYINHKYGDELEHLWEKSPENAIWRNKINRKWYGIIMVINENKLDGADNALVEIIDLRYPKEDLENFVDNRRIFKGYHMNKHSWITIKLDGSVDNKELFELIDVSYQISLKK